MRTTIDTIVVGSATINTKKRLAEEKITLIIDTENMPSKYEKRAKESLEEHGWRVDVKWGMNRYSAWNDYFHIFDICALKDGQLRWVSVKGKAGAPTAHQKEVAEIDIPGWKEIWRYDRSPKDKRKIRRRIWRFEDGERKKINF